jgi:transcriptional regulator with XRE-family HTH domain
MTADGGSGAVRDHPAGRDRRGRRVATAEGENPAVQGRRLRAALRQARQKADLTLEQVAAALDVSPSKIVRIESGAVRVSTIDLKALLDLYEITDQDRVAEFVSMAKAARQPPWWRKYREFTSPRYFEYVELEQAAAAAVNFQPQLVPGLLQTRNYASAIIHQPGPDITEERANGLLEFRMERQKLLDVPEPPMLSFVLDESAVHRQIGSAETMEEQIRHLIELAGRPNITIHILRFTAGLVPGMQAPFVVLQFPDRADPDALFLESPRGDTLVATDQDEVSRYRDAFAELEQASLSGPDSVKFLDGLARERQ